MTFREIGTVETASAALAARGYLTDRPLALAISLAVTLEQPLLLEGEAGVGKTEVARALAEAAGARLIRLQCHEGIDIHHAVYDWDYPRQLLALRAAEGGIDEGELFARRFLLRRPLLEALESKDPLDILAYQYDIVCNGVELSSGAIRNHRPDIMNSKVFEESNLACIDVDFYD